VFIRTELRHLDGLEGRVASALEPGSKATREALVGLFLEVHRQRERWSQLEALCSAAELPSDPKPQKRIESIRAAVEKLLESIAPPTIAAPAAAPEPGARPAELSAAAQLATKLLSQMTVTMDDAARAQLLGNLQALKGEKLPQSDLLAFVLLWLSRSDVDSGLIVDRVRVKTANVDTFFDGTFEKQSDFFVKLRTAAGKELVAYRENNAWVAQLPGDIRYDGCQVTATARVRTASSERIKAVLDLLPPGRWMSAPASEHLRAAKSAAEADRRKEIRNDRGLVLLRALAAGHAGAALRIGTPGKFSRRAGRCGLGYTQAPTARGASRRPARGPDRPAPPIERGRRRGRCCPVPRIPVPGSYRTAAVLLVSPVRSVDELNCASAAVDLTLTQA
jgi:hypothetical protein